MTTYYEEGMLDVLMKLGMVKAADDPDVGAQLGYERSKEKAKKEKAEAAAKKGAKPKKPPSAKDAVKKTRTRTRVPSGQKGLLAGVPMWAKVLGGAGVGAGGYAAYKKYMENKQQPPVAQYPGVGTI